MKKLAYPVIDLFAGPGGLGEGFAGLTIGQDRKVFRTLVSIERDKFAYQTLLLRHFFRNFKSKDIPKDYYDYLSGDLVRDELIRRYPEEWQHAESSALQISLGPKSHNKVKRIIKKRLSGREKWVLVGGPPCQAYSLVGRSRMMGRSDFDQDERHFLYKEYLKTIIDHRPPVFVMENVKGLLSAKVNGGSVIEKILKDLSKPKKAIGKSSNGLIYRLYSLSEKGEFDDGFNPSSFIVKAERHGVPQARHRIFIVGIRSDIDVVPEILQKTSPPSVEKIIGGMPPLRSGVSKAKDSADLWRQILSSISKTPWYKKHKKRNTPISITLNKYLSAIDGTPSERSSREYLKPKVMVSWYRDKNLKVLTSHETRSHMETDLHRYLFAAAYSEALDMPPKLYDFPAELLPNHKNVKNGKSGAKFVDRFRVQMADRVSTTITSHISKDGHYYIHYDPSQCRSLTVREAARLQTFPDNYHFEGPRTSQYHQVGNAVPPFLARQIAEIIKNVLDKMPGN